MRTTQYDQYDYAMGERQADGIKILTLHPFIIMPFMIPGPDGQPTQVKVPVEHVQIAMTPDTQRALHRWLAEPTPSIATTDGGMPQPDDVALRVCGRLQEHASHVYPAEGVTWWCDGTSAAFGSD